MSQAVVVGEIATIITQVRDAGGNPITNPSSISITLTDPSGAETAPSVTTGVAGQFSTAVVLPTEGDWRYEWAVVGGLPTPAEGTITVGSIFEGAVSDLRDLRVLVPACRRAIDGPLASEPDSPSTTLSDTQVLALIADATGTLILESQGESQFGYQLLVTSRDPFYKAPVGWVTDSERKPAADAAILSQAALDHYFWMIRDLKVSESIKNEAQEYDYSRSAGVIQAWIQYLIGNRDKAVAALQVINAPLDVYISMVAERDRLSAAWLEPWVAEVGAPVPYAGGGGSGPLEYDYRFNTWG